MTKGLAVFKALSGNIAVVTMYAQDNANECRLGFDVEWRNRPTAQDEGDVKAAVFSYLHLKENDSTAHMHSKSQEESDRLIGSFLLTGDPHGVKKG